MTRQFRTPDRGGARVKLSNPSGHTKGNSHDTSF
jgi:hypothetical protein